MTQLEDQLRAVLLATPTPPTTIGNPLADLDHRVGRAKSRWATAGVAALAVLVAAIVVPLSVLGKNAKAARYDAPPPVAWPNHRVLSMTVAADGSVWTLSTPSGGNGHLDLSQLEPSSGRLLAKHHVPGWTESIAAVGNRIWFWGGGDGGYPNGVVGVLDPATGQRASRILGRTAVLNPAFAGSPAAAAGDELVGIQRGNDAIVGFRLTGDRITRYRIDTLPDAGWVFAFGSNAIVSSNTGVQRIEGDVAQNGPAPVLAYTGRPLAPAGQSGSTWVADGDAVVRETSTGGRIGSPVTAPALFGPDRVPVTAATDGSGGLYVGFARAAGARPAAALAYYSPQSLGLHQPTPTAYRLKSSGYDLATDLAGGVVYLQGNPIGFGTVMRWDPTSVTPPKPAPARVGAQTWRSSGVVRVAAGPNQVWDLVPSAQAASRVEERDPSTGAVRLTYGDPDRDALIDYGLNRVWLWSDGTGAGPDPKMIVERLGPGGDGEAVSLPGDLLDKSLTFASGYAWADSTVGMLKFAIGSDQTVSVFKSSRRAFDDAEQITAEQLAVSRGSSPTSRSGDLLERALAAVKSGYLMVDRNELVIDDDTGHPVGQPLALPAGLRSEAVLASAGAVVDSNGGLYVWIDAPRIGAPDLLYYSPTSVQEVQPTPSAVLRGGGVHNAAIDPTGGVVAATTGGALIHWDPATRD